MELLDGKVLTGLNSIIIGKKVPIESADGKTSAKSYDTFNEDRKVVGRWNLLGKNTEEITLNLNMRLSSNIKLRFRHEQDPREEIPSLLRHNSPYPDVNFIMFTFVNYDKIGMTTWTKSPILLFTSAALDGPMLVKTNVTLDFVMQRLTQEPDAKEIFWQYYFTLCESTSYTVPKEGHR